MHSLHKAYFAGFLFAVIIGFSFLFVKIALPFISPLDMLAHRFTVAFLSSTLFLYFSKESIEVSGKDLLAIIPLALFYPIGFFAFQVFGLTELPTSEAGMIQAAIPAFTLLLAIFFLHEYPTYKQGLCVGLSVSGILYISWMNGICAESYTFLGIGLILLSSLCSSFYNVFARSLTRKYSVFTLTFIMSFLGFLFFNGIALGIHLEEGTLSQILPSLLNSEVWISILYLGALSSFGTSFLSNFALSQLEASQMGVFSNFATVVTIFAGAFFLHESTYYYHMIGAIIIVAGVLGTNYFSDVKRKYKMKVQKVVKKTVDTVAHTADIYKLNKTK